MPISTVNISFQDDLLREIDSVAKTEARSRSELIREAARAYIQRKQKFDKILTTGLAIGKSLELTEDDLINEIKTVRKK